MAEMLFIRAVLFLSFFRGESRMRAACAAVGRTKGLVFAGQYISFRGMNEDCFSYSLRGMR